MGKMRNAYKIVVGEPEGKRPLGRTRRRWADNFKIDIKGIGCKGVEWFHLVQDMDR
jgi:hypothetical protein